MRIPLASLLLMISVDTMAAQELLVGKVAGKAVRIESTEVDSRSAQACARIRRLVRSVAREAAMADAGVALETEAETRMLREMLPSRKAVEEQHQESNRQAEALRDALRESKSDPTRDHEIWAEKLKAFMSWETWVNVRSKYAESAIAQKPYPDTVSDAHWAQMHEALLEVIRERHFQDWVLRTWAPTQAKGDRVAWSSELQHRFWSEALEKFAVSVSAWPGCDSVRPADFMATRQSTRREG